MNNVTTARVVAMLS